MWTTVARYADRWVEGHPLAGYLAGQLAYRAVQLVALLLAVSTLLFVLLRLSADPAAVLAGEGASPAQLRAVAHAYGLDLPLWRQYLAFLGQALRLNFGESPVHHVAALALVLRRLPATLVLAGTAMALNVLVAVSLGLWLGFRPDRAARRAALVLVLASQGIPAFVVGLLLIQVFAVSLRLLPSIGAGRPVSLVLPACTLAWFLAPRAARLTASSVDAAMRQAWVRTARAMGATSRELLWRHVLPNSLLATLALLGVQFAFLLSGSLVIESLFAWPGLGQLLVDSVRAVDFPVVEAAVFVIAVLVFGANALVDVLLPAIDPRLRSRSA
ncbi:MAG TPA: ABC transporter permease [Candidatus Dormibacteraeota bacterium]